MLPDIPAEQASSVLEAIARDILAEGGVAEPPVDAFELARRLGLVVARDGASNVRARFVRLGSASVVEGQGTILLADEPRPERRHWAIAHEVGESYAHRVFAALGVSPVDAQAAAREEVANRLAGSLLLPREWFLREGRLVGWDLLDLKSRFATASHEMIARRMLEMPPAAIITLFDQGRAVWRKSNLPGRTPPLTDPERAAWQAAYEAGKPAQCDGEELPDGVEDVRAWPIHEPDWRREIVRTAIASEW